VRTSLPGARSRLPATLSRDLTSFCGGARLSRVIASDDLEMRAITDQWGRRGGGLALAAGCDLLLFCHRQDWLRAAVEAVEHAVVNGRLPEARVADAYRRVTRLMQWRRRHVRRERLAVIGCAAHRRLAAALRA
jgi:beta-N-acetylhexosaminidase